MPRSEKQFAQIRERSRLKILAAAVELFAERGFHSTTIAAISERAGVATGLPYNYFAGKDELLMEIIKGAQTELGALVDLHLKQTAVGDIRGFMNGMLSAMKSKLETWRLLMSIALQPQARDISKDTPSGFEKILLRAVLTDGIVGDSNGPWSPREIAEVLHAIMIAYCVTENEALARRLIDLLPISTRVTHGKKAPRGRSHTP